MARSTFYYQLKQSKLPDKYAREKEEIVSIYHEHQGHYGHRRITAEMKNRGYLINHKTTIKLMKTCGVKCRVRLRKYLSYRGEQAKLPQTCLNATLLRICLIRNGLQILLSFPCSVKNCTCRQQWICTIEK
ncbi:MAG: IS3 family transposase [Bacteroidales bacterium]